MSESDRYITIDPAARRWRARFAGHVIADTADARVLHEGDMAPVIYFPREDVAMEYMAKADRRTHCPYKGDAAYYTILMDGHFAENGVWSYESPLMAVEEIGGMLAFDTAMIEVYDVDAEAVGAAPAEPRTLADETVDETVMHTDSGAGRSQRDRWEPDVPEPRQEPGSPGSI